MYVDLTAMAASKWPRRSHISSDLNSVASKTYVPTSLWPLSPFTRSSWKAKYHPLTCAASLASKKGRKEGKKDESMRLWAEPRPVLQVGTVGSISLQSIDRQTRRTTDAGNESWHWRRREKGLREERRQAHAPLRLLRSFVGPWHGRPWVELS